MYIILSYFLWLLFIIWLFLRYSYKPCRNKTCLIGKTAIVTGGSRGIGFETAMALASRGCRVIIACRSTAENEKNEIIRRTHNPKIITKHLDLSSLESVRQFANGIKNEEEKIDILINNAGISTANEFTKDNLNLLMQTNYFGAFLLTHLLLDLMKKSTDGRIIFVSSFLVHFHNLTLENLNFPLLDKERFLTTLALYSNSKLCQIIASNIFAEKLKKFNIKSNAIHPGPVGTSLFNNAEKLVTGFVFMWKVMVKLFFKTPEEGADPIMRMAISNKHRNTTGQFLWDLGVFPSPCILNNKTFCESIWKESEKYVKLNDNEKL